MAKHRPAGWVETDMKPRLQLLLITTFAWFGWVAFDRFPGTTQTAFAQSSSDSSRSDSESRDRDRGRFGDRGSRDWRSSRSRRDDEHREDEKRGDEHSTGSSTSSTSSDNTSGSSRSASSSSSAPSTSTSTPSTAASSSLDLKKWATALVVKNDKNGDMILQKEEQGFLGSSAAAEDLNHDGMITVDEIVMHHSAGVTVSSQPKSSGTSTASTSSASGRTSDNRSKTDDAMAKRVLVGTAGGTGKDADKRHSYRFSKATDKLPTGLPTWFKSRDTNSDGQVSMREYSRSVSQSMVSEFRRYDANDDGMITAKEAARQK